MVKVEVVRWSRREASWQEEAGLDKRKQELIGSMEREMQKGGLRGRR